MWQHSLSVVDLTLKHWVSIHYNVHIVTLPVTLEDAVGLGSVRVLVGNGNPDNCELPEKSAAKR